ncbi:hypothetical protein MCERE19_00834 [Spirosomataceae bacterium]|jgi:hypothetical protein
MGGFRQSSRESFSTKSHIKQYLASENPVLTQDFLPEFEEFTVNNSNELQIETPESKIKLSSENVKEKKEHLSFENIQSEVEITLSEKSAEIVKKRPIKRNPVFNDSLKIGVIFLLIASALALIPALLQLGILFALVAIVLLFIGLKKLFKRRAKIKKKEIRKENNQMRKEKIKDLFKK